MPTRAHVPAVLAAAAACAAFGALVVAWAAGGGTLDAAWAPTLDSRLTFTLDGLGALYALLATGVGAVVFAYSARYLPAHLEEGGRDARESWRFHGLLVLFMGSMVGLATAQDLLVLFVCWDLTAVASYLLIGFDRHEREARLAALMALLVTAISAVALLIGSLMLHARYGTFALPEIIELARSGPHLTITGALIAVAGLAKCAQVPLHFWLPRAMAAPTPVSAYLHSAAMVAAGVFLLGRFHPLLSRSEILLDMLLAVGLLSILVGGVLALTRDNLKQLLAYSTVSQYGYVVTMLGMGTAKGALAASFYVVVHGIAKSGLFLTAGAVTSATRAEHLSDVQGLARRAPLLAVGSGMAAATLAALPLTAGFFKDELFFAAALERGPLLTVAAVAAAALTLAYVGRFWSGIFLGPSAPVSEERSERPARSGGEAAPPARGLTVPVVVLGALGLAGGLWNAPLLGLAESAGAVTFGDPVPGEAAYHLDLRAENLMAVAAYTAGAVILGFPVLWVAAAGWMDAAGRRFGPERAYERGLASLNRMSDAIHALEVRDLRVRIAAVLVPGGLLVLLGFLATPTAGAYEIGTVGVDDLPLAAALLVVAFAAAACTGPRDHLRLVLTLSSLGFSLAVVYAFFGAPDVALVAVLVETVFALVFLGVFALLPRDVVEPRAPLRARRWLRRRDGLIGVASGAAAFVVVWGALSRPAPQESVSARHIAEAPDAHAADVVTAILADFRGLDTLVEVTVVLTALIGMGALLRRGRLG
jgi:multicomponent Na+:H+ antiporter subunit A